jgi:hypothetical protein
MQQHNTKRKHMEIHEYEPDSTNPTCHNQVAQTEQTHQEKKKKKKKKTHLILINFKLVQQDATIQDITFKN